MKASDICPERVRGAALVLCLAAASSAHAQSVAASVELLPNFQPAPWSVEPGDLVTPMTYGTFLNWRVSSDWVVCGQPGHWEQVVDTESWSSTAARLYGANGPVRAPLSQSALHPTSSSVVLRLSPEPFWSVSWCPCGTWPPDDCSPDERQRADSAPVFVDATLWWPPKPCPGGTIRYEPPTAADGCGTLRLTAAGTPGDRVDFEGWYSLDGGLTRSQISRFAVPGSPDAVSICPAVSGCERIRWHVRVVCRAGGEICAVAASLGEAPIRSAIPCSPQTNPVLFRTPRSQSIVMGVRGLTAGDTVIERQNPLAGWAVRWHRILEGAEAGEWLTDGPQSTGSSISGSETPILRMSGFSDDDVGDYAMYVIPPGGSIADAVYADAAALQDDVGQPFFIRDLEPIVMCGSGPTAFEVQTGGDPNGVDDLRVFVNGQPVIFLPSPLETRCTLPNGISLRLDRFGGGVDGIHSFVLSDVTIPASIDDPRVELQLCAVNALGQTSSFMVPVRFVAGPPRIVLNADTSIDVTTRAFASGDSAYVVRVRASLDGGLTWVDESVPVTHSSAGELQTHFLPRRAPTNRVSPALIEVSIVSGCGTVGTLSELLPAAGYVPDCLPSDLEPSDFRCAECPPEVRCRFDIGQSFEVPRRIPVGLGAASWAYYDPVNGTSERIVDGPTGRGASTAQGSATTTLRISNTSWDDHGWYVLIVTPPTGPAYIAEVVEVQESIDSCPGIARSPMPVSACPGQGEFTLELVPEGVPGQFAWYIDDQAWDALGGQQEGTVSYGDMSFQFVHQPPGTLHVTAYSSPTVHRLTGAVTYFGCADGGSITAKTFPTPIFVRVAGCGGCEGDIDGSSTVDGADLGALLSQWGAGGSADLDRDGVVTGADLGRLLSRWGPCVP